jgi:hypothetical protein
VRRSRRNKAQLRRRSRATRLFPLSQTKRSHRTQAASYFRIASVHGAIAHGPAVGGATMFVSHYYRSSASNFLQVRRRGGEGGRDTRFQGRAP